MLPHYLKTEGQGSTSSEQGPSDLSNIFNDMSSTSAAANEVVPATKEEKREAAKSTMVFEMLTKCYQPREEHIKRKKARITLNEAGRDFDPKTPTDTSSRWDSGAPFMSSYNTKFSFTQSPLNFFSASSPPNSFHLPPLRVGLKTEEELMRMKGPTRLIAFLVDIAMDETARRALRWTGFGLEFILVNKELVAQMWGNRKHNTKNMDYYKLSRAIREKYDKKDKNTVTKTGKLKKGQRTYSYVFTENAYSDLENQTGKSIKTILNFAKEIGEKYKDSSDISSSSSPQPLSPPQRV